MAAWPHWQGPKMSKKHPKWADAVRDFVTGDGNGIQEQRPRSCSLSYFSVAVIKYQDQYNLRKKSFYITILEVWVNHGREVMAGWQELGVGWSHFHLKTRSKEKEQEVDQCHKPSKPTPSDIPTLARFYLLKVPCLSYSSGKTPWPMQLTGGKRSLLEASNFRGWARDHHDKRAWQQAGRPWHFSIS